jgi:hypothetical protein
MSHRPERLLSIACCSLFYATSGFAQFLNFLPKFDKEFTFQGSYSKISFDQTEILGFGTHVGGGIFIAENLSVVGGYFNMADATGATVLNGFDSALKLYLLSDGSSKTIEGDGKQISIRSAFTHYALLGYKLRQLVAEELAPQYSGLNYGYGANWFVGRTLILDNLRNAFLNIEFETGKLASAQGNSSRSSNFALGLGLTF